MQFQRRIKGCQASRIPVVDRRRLSCSTENCGREFNSPMLLLVHQLDSGHLDNLCCMCYKTFSRKPDLRRHIKSLHLQQQFSCFQCEEKRTYSRRDSLYCHQLKHHGMVTCDQCGAGFNKVKWLKEHLNKHF